MSVKVNEVITFLNEIYPQDLASDFDIGKIGLNIGNENIEISNVLLALDATYDVILEAINNNCNLIICHHPFIFNPITRIDYRNSFGKSLALLLKHQITVFSLHTNFDAAKSGMNDALIQQLGFIPEKSNIQKDSFLKSCFISEQSLKNLIELVKEKFALKGIRYLGNLDAKIKKIGIIGGSGASIDILPQLQKEHIDCFITGEVKLHIAQYFYNFNMNLIEVNHGIEKYGLVNIRNVLESRFKAKFGLLISKIDTDPLMYM